jgi:hypothetical protein
MYYPYLRARQFELIALRELAQEGAIRDLITPILEPVKDAVNNLNLAFNIFRQCDQPAYLIVNSTLVKGLEDPNHFISYIKNVDDEFTRLKPAFIYSNNFEYIQRAIVDNDIKNCMLICSNDVDANDAGFLELIAMQQLTAFTVEDPGRNRSLNRVLKNTGKTFIRLDDEFEPQVRNRDFLALEERKFSEEQAYFKEDGYDGFSNYTTLPKAFTEGGSAPRAVVIHLTYLQNIKEVWIKHFTSTTNDSIANVQGKFAEAAEKAVEFCRAQGLTNSAIVELEKYFDEQHYPGLGTVKKVSIKNHLLVVCDYLRSV